MNVETILRTAFAVMICTSAQGFPAQAASADSQREKDVYSIYSLMMINPETRSRRDDNQRYLIAATTSLGYPETPCVRPPIRRAADFREVIADFESRKTRPRQLTPAFSSNKPYVLLSAEEVNEFMQSKAQGAVPKSQRAQFEGVTDLFTLSDVYFNLRGTLALTAISDWCGDSCALWRWRVFEKLSDGNWEERKTFYMGQGFWVTCVAVDKKLP